MDKVAKQTKVRHYNDNYELYMWQIGGGKEFVLNWGELAIHPKYL